MTLKYSQILVAVDGSKEAEWAFKKSVGIAKRNNATLNLANIIDTRSFAAIEAYDRSIADRAQRFAEDLLNNYKKEAMDAGVQSVNTLVDYGSPKTLISRDIAGRVHADLIVCGATGLNAVERFLIGSVSEHIVRSAKCDVLVVRTEEPYDEIPADYETSTDIDRNFEDDGRGDKHYKVGENIDRR
ncbi:universal stress protein [Planococcus sp. N028]|uniref:Universal stress protein n=1 Tax=Planococcus shixiaomingii TaxID=3058393 RepID=A0ABT8MX83_9BACL|nr:MULTISPECIES: universal stress protein [unclassified Planococcus (in: firmicutes)]MDN7240251.1 universal stress protein [Planococcus sp. N028]WKA56154.1 universal stress protein [Planococcus sp. N022]